MMGLFPMYGNIKTRQFHRRLVLTKRKISDMYYLWSAKISLSYLFFSIRFYFSTTKNLLKE